MDLSEKKQVFNRVKGLLAQARFNIRSSNHNMARKLLMQADTVLAGGNLDDKESLALHVSLQTLLLLMKV